MWLYTSRTLIYMDGATIPIFGCMVSATVSSHGCDRKRKIQQSPVYKFGELLIIAIEIFCIESLGPNPTSPFVEPSAYVENNIDIGSN